MAPPRWTTPEELQWLQNQLPEFLQMQKDQKLTRFYELLFPRWFNQFPEHFNVWKPTGNPPSEGGVQVHQGDESSDTNSDESGLLPLTPEQEVELEEANETRRKKLREWFRNNAKSKTTPGNTSTGKALAQLLGQRARGIRDLKEIEVYSKTHYKVKIQPLVEDDIQENQLDLKQRIGVVQKYTNSCFAAESEEVKADIREEMTRINAARRLLSIVSDKCTKEEIYRAIQELPIVLGQICEDLAVLTGGWHYTLVMGGPDPMCQGDIMTLSFHHGKGPDGLSFKASNPNFHEQYLVPFEKYLRGIFGAHNNLLPIPSLVVPAPPDFTAPNAQNNSEELYFHAEAENSFPADSESPGTHNYPHGSLMDPDFTVSEAEINALIASIPPLAPDSPNGRWWVGQSQDMQMAAPPSINPPPAITGSLIASSTPPRIRRPRLNAVSTEGQPSLSPTPRLPPVDILRTVDSTLAAVSNEGQPSLSLTPQLPPVDILHAVDSTPAAIAPSALCLNDSDSPPSVSSPPALLTDAISIPAALDVLLPAGCVPPVSSAPGRRSVRTTRLSTRAEDANKIGDNVKPITSKRKRKGVTGHPVTAKKYIPISVFNALHILNVDNHRSKK
ncbi:hypothetical protein DFH29DRAFT_997396 [Suillus ampliporus]|nr:hypothetical protein DFH29DRAFT_997396 [Suillus ampliporus]